MLFMRKLKLVGHCIRLYIRDSNCEMSNNVILEAFRLVSVLFSL